MKVTVLGCGGSGGVPLADGNWGLCKPGNPKNRRRRVSVLVETPAASILVDTSPDLRDQLLAARAQRIDAVLYTHDHADHSHGIDDLRAFVLGRNGARIPTYGAADTLAVLRERFTYLFEQVREGSSMLYRPSLEARELAGPFSLNGVPVVPFEQDHGHGTRSIGYRIGRMAYSTDVVGLSDAAFEVLAGLDLWIVDCLRYEPHPTHSHFEQTLSWVARAKPKRTILTHLNHTLDYDELAARCPPGVEPGYDGLTVELRD
jgi:phosphoribosyl 1,2-cyclic phosphate phosphodiesterase